MLTVHARRVFCFFDLGLVYWQDKWAQQVRRKMLADNARADATAAAAFSPSSSPATAAHQKAVGLDNDAQSVSTADSSRPAQHGSFTPSTVLSTSAHGGTVVSTDYAGSEAWRPEQQLETGRRGPISLSSQSALEELPPYEVGAERLHVVDKKF